MNDLTITELGLANLKRQAEWDPANVLTASFRGNELAGEVGEACNVIKKLERARLGLPGSRSTLEALAEELADGVICISLIAATEGIDLAQAIVDKFNKTSDKIGLGVRL